MCARVIGQLRSGALLLDEVDLLLHPLKSELNWPLGTKAPLDFTQAVMVAGSGGSSGGSGASSGGGKQQSSGNRSVGLRWLLPWHLLDVLLHCTPNGAAAADSASAERANTAAGAAAAMQPPPPPPPPLSCEIGDVGEKRDLVRALRAALADGCADRDLQLRPHLVVLNETFYNARLRPLLARWTLLWLHRHHVYGDSQRAVKAATEAGVTDTDLLEFLSHGAAGSGSSSGNGSGNGIGRGARGAVDGGDDDHDGDGDGMGASALKLERTLPDSSLKMLRLGHEWLVSLLPHVLSKTCRVHYGVLTPAELARALRPDMAGPRMPESRRVLAVPFVGKDVPSAASEFSHPDVVIGFSILGYRHQVLHKRRGGGGGGGVKPPHSGTKKEKEANMGTEVHTCMSRRAHDVLVRRRTEVRGQKVQLYRGCPAHCL
jgi:hypothetical protein